METYSFHKDEDEKACQTFLTIKIKKRTQKTIKIS